MNQISLFIDIVKNVIESLKWYENISDLQKTRSINAHKAIYDAYIDTSEYLRNSNGANNYSPELARSWNEASTQVMLIDKNLGEILFMKSRFWNDPELFERLNRTDEIITLEEVIDELKKLRNKIS